jgi:hypothetical protein
VAGEGFYDLGFGACVRLAAPFDLRDRFGSYGRFPSQVAHAPPQQSAAGPTCLWGQFRHNASVDKKNSYIVTVCLTIIYKRLLCHRFKVNAMQKLFSTQLTRRDVFRAAWRIVREDRLSIGPALRRAWAWARKKGQAAAERAGAVVTPSAPVSGHYAQARAYGVFSPLDRSPAANAFFAARAGRGRGCGSYSTGR